MSGGHFDYAQYRCDEMADEIWHIISTKSGDYSPATIERFKQAADTLRRAGMMAHRVDWLISGDDGEESFHRRWEEKLGKMEGTK